MTHTPHNDCTDQQNEGVKCECFCNRVSVGRWQPSTVILLLLFVFCTIP
nr:hypothetical protein [Tawny frogmouth aviadenovirus A]